MLWAKSRRIAHQKTQNKRCHSTIVGAIVLQSAACVLGATLQVSVDGPLVTAIVSEESRAGRLKFAGDVCLGINGDRDPSAKLMKDLKARGFAFQKASACLKAPKGILLSIGRIVKLRSNEVRVGIEISNLTIEPGSHFATLLSSGTYKLANPAESEWSILSYEPSK
jgi:hypothetical protein